MDSKNILPITIWSLRIYNGLMSLLYFCIFVFLILMIFAGTKSSDRSAEIITLVIFTAILLPMNILHLAALVFAGKQKQWVWVLQISTVCLGFGAFITLVPCAVLLILLVSKEVKGYYFNASGKLIVYFPGFSMKNFEEGEHIVSALEKKGNKVYFHKWRHWEKGNENIQWDAQIEINRALDSIAKFSPLEIILIGKSIGSYIAANIAKQRYATTKQLILLGIPVNDLSEDEKIFYSSLSKVSYPIILIQNKDDVHGAISQAREVLKGVKYQEIVKANDTHRYDYPDLVSTLVI